MKFGDKLLKLRKLNGMSQEDLAEKLNVTRQTISKWELEQSKPDMGKFLEISKLKKVLAWEKCIHYNSIYQKIVFPDNCVLRTGRENFQN